jgi:hypothetical protein
MSQLLPVPFDSAGVIQEREPQASIMSQSPKVAPHLPMEIHLEIMSYADTATLHNLCLTSRAMYAAALPILYHTCEQMSYLVKSRDRVETGPGGFGGRSQRIFRPVCSIVEAITRRPDLASKVHTLVLRGVGLQTVESSLPWLPRVGDAPTNNLPASHQDISTDASESLHRHMQSLIVLFCLCPFLKTVRTVCDDKKLYFPKMIETHSMLAGRRLLGHLTTLQLDGFDPQHEDGTRLVLLGWAETLHLPTLRDLTLCNLDICEGWNKYRGRHGAIQVQSLTIVGGCAGADWVAKCLLPEFERLRSFRYVEAIAGFNSESPRSPMTRGVYPQPYTVCLHRLSMGLWHVRHSLETLVYDLKYRPGPALLESVTVSFGEFTRLKHLDIWQQAVVPVRTCMRSVATFGTEPGRIKGRFFELASPKPLSQLVPSSLETLNLREADIRTPWVELREWFTDRSATSTSASNNVLRLLMVETPDRPLQNRWAEPTTQLREVGAGLARSESEVGKLRDGCRESGVAFRYHLARYPDYYELEGFRGYPGSVVYTA